MGSGSRAEEQRARAALTDGAHVAAERCHHERRGAGAVGGVHPRAVAQQQLQALHAVREGCGVQGRPEGATQLVLSHGNAPTSPANLQVQEVWIFFPIEPELSL